MVDILLLEYLNIAFDVLQVFDKIYWTMCFDKIWLGNRKKHSFDIGYIVILEKNAS